MAGASVEQALSIAATAREGRKGLDQGGGKDVREGGAARQVPRSTPKHEESGKGRQERKRSRDEVLTSRRDLELLDAVGPDGGENYRHFREWVGVDGGESKIIRVSASSQAVAESEAKGIREQGYYIRLQVAFQEQQWSKRKLRQEREMVREREIEREDRVWEKGLLARHPRNLYTRRPNNRFRT